MTPMLKKNKKLSYAERIQYCLNPTAKHLCKIIANKRSNLALSVDVNATQELIALADRLGPEICLLKTHVDILADFNFHFIAQLKALAKKHEFLIFEDRKFADIGNTVKEQYKGGIYRIVEWADISNAHIIPGPDIIRGLQSIGLIHQRGLLLIAEMSSSGSLARGAYTQASINLAKNFPDFVIGFIAIHQLVENPGLLHMTPGIQWTQSEDNLGQQYLCPEHAILKNRTDIIIVGRGIYRADDPLAEARRYRQAAWEAYLSCC
jgi:uridine monophosphate synthetase